MKPFSFHNPTKLFMGRGVNSKVGKEISRHGHRKVLLLAGGGSIRENGVYESVVESLSAAQIQVVEKWGIRPNPVLSFVREAIALARSENVDAVLAVGGGSVADTAKAVAAGARYPGDIWELFEVRGSADEALPLFVVLTLSATGSEMNGNAVITNEDEKKKWAFGGPSTYPVASFVDPGVQIGLPWRQTVNGLVDAISHILEFYFMGTTEEPVIAFNEMLLTTLIATGDRLQSDPSDFDARSHLAWCSTLALNGMSGVAMAGGDWSTHMMEHGISALFPEVAHAEGLAVMFPAWIDYLHRHEVRPAQLARFASKVWGVDHIEEALTRMRATYSRWGAPIRLSDLGITAEDIPSLAQNVARMGTLGRLLPLDRSAVAEVYRLAL